MGLFSKKTEAIGTVIESTGTLAEKIGNAFDKNFTTQEEKMQARNELVGDTNKLISAIINIQSAIILAEAEGSKLQRNWRPILMITFGGIIVCTWVIFPIINLFVKSPEFAQLILGLKDAKEFWDIVSIGIGGYVISRSVEKITDSVGKNMNINIGKK